ncbi:MAG: class I SAM-dependent methyltransferase [Gaiellales bacterium]
MSVYDTIGTSYADTRRPDERIAAQIHAAVGEGSVVNVGAGAGSYEPPNTVLAVEPSAAMIAQRPAGSARCVQAGAEAIPAADGAFDVALAVLTIHHWTDVSRGLAEMRRVARRQVILTWDPDVFDRFWLIRDYLPESGAWDRARCPSVAEVAAHLGGEVEPVPIPHGCTDGFAGAYWRRPHAYLDPSVRANISLLAQQPEKAAAGIERLARDLESGMWAEHNAELLALDVFDVGYRLIRT